MNHLSDQSGDHNLTQLGNESYQSDQSGDHNGFIGGKSNNNNNLQSQNKKTYKQSFNMDSYNNNNINFPVKFGTEDINVVCQKLGDILTPLFSNLSVVDTIPDLFNKIHNSSELPQYRNVYSPQKDSKIAYVSNGKEFEKREINELIENIIEKNRDILSNFIQNNQNFEDIFENFQVNLDDHLDIISMTIKNIMFDYKKNFPPEKK